MKVLLFLVAPVLTVVASNAAAQSPQFTMTPAELALHENAAPVFVYRYADVPRKPYLKEWYTPKGLNILRDAPYDHLHHHGLMMAIKVNDVNYWEETAAGGYQQHRMFNNVSLDPAGQGFRQFLAWHGPDAEPDISESRSIHHSPLSNENVRVLTWQSDFCLYFARVDMLRSDMRRPRGDGRDDNQPPATLGGNIYHGLGMRFPEFMDKVGVFIMADDMTGAFDDGPHHLAQARWCAYTVEHDETPVTVAMFNCPDNPRPTLWFTMLQPFAYLSGTQDLQREPMVLKSWETITMRYGVAAWDAIMDKADIEALYQAWVESVKQ